MQQARISRRMRWQGTTALAAELGITRQHLCAVLNGRRKPGPELETKLKERGIKPHKLRRPGERWV